MESSGKYWFRADARTMLCCVWSAIPGLARQAAGDFSSAPVCRDKPIGCKRQTVCQVWCRQAPHLKSPIILDDAEPLLQ